MKMAISDIPAGYWASDDLGRRSPMVRAYTISKTAWMDLYYDLYQQIYGENATSQEDVIADAEERLRILKQAGIRQ